MLVAGASLPMSAIVVWFVFLPASWKSDLTGITYWAIVCAVSLLVLLPFDKFCDEYMNWLQPSPDDKQRAGSNSKPGP